MTEKQEPADALGCGRQLRRTREKLALSVDDVAGELRLSGFQIQALEEDDWSQLPGDTYARGYLRSYARLLGLDADQLLAGASTQEIELSRKEPEIEVPARDEAAQATPEDAAAVESPGRSARGWLGMLLVAVVIAAGYWQYRSGWPLVPDGAVPQAGEPEQAAAPVEDTEPETLATAAADDAPPTPTSPDKAVFEFKGRSWLEVRDAAGKRLVYRAFPPGRRVEVQGEPPFHIYLGNAGAVRVEYMGDAVAPDTGSGRLYARFVLGAGSG